MRHIPFLLVGFRMLLAPTVILLGYQGSAFHAWIVLVCYLALISDIFDGIIARYAQVDTVKLRLWDCYADLIFWLSACWCIGLAFPSEVMQRSYIIVPLLLLEWVPDLIYYFRFRKGGCAHSYLGKTFGLVLLTNFTLLFGFQDTTLFTLTVVVGLLAQLDRIGIALILPSRVCDVPSAYHARLIRKGIPFKKYKLFHS